MSRERTSARCFSGSNNSMCHSRATPLSPARLDQTAIPKELAAKKRYVCATARERKNAPQFSQLPLGHDVLASCPLVYNVNKRANSRVTPDVPLARVAILVSKSHFLLGKWPRSSLHARRESKKVMTALEYCRSKHVRRDAHGVGVTWISRVAVRVSKKHCLLEK